MKALGRPESKARPPMHPRLAYRACPSGLCSCSAALGHVLAQKYAALGRARRTHDALGVDAAPMQIPGARRARQAELARLAARYPGALRELERFEPSELRWRHLAAARVSGCAPLFLRLVWDYHALWHRGLAYRRYCRTQDQSRPLPNGGRGTLVSSFACWYERAERGAPWVSSAIFARWLSFERGVHQKGSRPASSLRCAVWTVLREHYCLDDSVLCEALWGDPSIDFNEVDPSLEQEKGF